MARKNQKPGPYTLPLPPLPKRPGWLNGNGCPNRDVNGHGGRNAWGHEVFDTWRKGKKPKPIPMPETELDVWSDDYPTRYVWKHGTYEEVPIRVRQDVYAWDGKRWVRCKSPRAIAKYAKLA